MQDAGHFSSYPQVDSSLRQNRLTFSLPLPRHSAHSLACACQVPALDAQFHGVRTACPPCAPPPAPQLPGCLKVPLDLHCASSTERAGSVRPCLVSFGTCPCPCVGGVWSCPQRPHSLEQGPQAFSVQGQRVNILGLAGQIASGVTTQFCHWGTKVGTGSTSTNGRHRVPVSTGSTSDTQ